MALASRYAEDELGRAIDRGVAQYVILGHKAPASFLRVFEVDLAPVSSGSGNGCVHCACPSHRTCFFVPLDLERETLMDGLRAAGYRMERPAFFSWLGTTQYLTTEALFKTLREIASIAPGSELVFTYHVPEGSLERGERQVRRVLSISSFEPALVAGRVNTAGFTEAVDFGPEQAHTRYFEGRTDELIAPRLSRLMTARVGGGDGDG